jgi:hypothetical protein
MVMGLSLCVAVAIEMKTFIVAYATKFLLCSVDISSLCHVRQVESILCQVT